jgi:hypothetical protein
MLRFTRYEKDKSKEKSSFSPKVYYLFCKTSSEHQHFQNKSGFCIHYWCVFLVITWSNRSKLGLNQFVSSCCCRCWLQWGLKTNRPSCHCQQQKSLEKIMNCLKKYIKNIWVIQNAIIKYWTNDLRAKFLGDLKVLNNKHMVFELPLHI